MNYRITPLLLQALFYSLIRSFTWYLILVIVSHNNFNRAPPKGTEDMIKNQLAIHIGNDVMPVGALHVLDREKLVRHPLYGPLRQFEFAFKMLGMRDIPIQDRMRLTNLWDQLTGIALSHESAEQRKIEMDILIDQVFIKQVNQYAPPFLMFGHDIDNTDLFGWQVDLDALEEVLNGDSSSAFLVSSDPNKPSFAHVFYYGDGLFMLRQSAAYDQVQGNVDLMDVGTANFIWQVNEKITVDIHNYLNKSVVEGIFEDHSMSVVELIRHPVSMQAKGAPWKN